MAAYDPVVVSQKKAFFKTALTRRMQSKTANKSLKWSFVNGFVCTVLVLHIWQFNYCYSLWWAYLECVIAIICSLNLLTNMIVYIQHLCRKPLKGTIRERQLLSFDASDRSFEVEEPPIQLNTTRQINSNVFTITWSSYLNPSKFSRKYNQQNSTPQRRGSPSAMDNSSPNVSTLSNNYTFNSSYAKYSRDDFMSDEESLQKYLDEFEERNSSEDDSNEHMTSGHVGSFGSFMDTASYLLKTSAYQLSPLISETPPNKELSRDSNKQNFAYVNSDILVKKTTAQISQYVANLRKWIAITILHRLVKEIDNINDSFKSRGIIEMEIGNIGLERLKKTVENQQFVNQYMPMLPLILPFLEISSNQEYLLQRIKDLAYGHCLADYRWNSGSSYHGLKWDEHLPTDSSIVFHLLCVYFDTQLMPLPQGGGRPFFSRYVVMNDEKRSMEEILDSIQNRAHCAILCTNPLQPKFNFISDKKVHNCVYDRNNLFHVIIQFLIYIKEQQDGLLEGVNLGRNGINILCIIGE